MTLSLHQAVVFITGAQGGLGVHLVQEALRRGATRVYASARTPRDWEDSRVVSVPLDVTDPASIAAAVAVAGDTTVLINNAGIEMPGRLLDTSAEDVRAVYETNVFGPIALVQAFAPVLAAQGGGAVINVHSALSWISFPGAYSSTKSALWGATNSLRVELLGQNTHVLGAHFGYADTPMTAHLDVPKSDPAVIAAAIYEALIAGEYEAFGDEVAQGVHGSLSAPLDQRYAALGITL